MLLVSFRLMKQQQFSLFLWEGFYHLQWGCPCGSILDRGRIPLQMAMADQEQLIAAKQPLQSVAYTQNLVSSCLSSLAFWRRHYVVSSYCLPSLPLDLRLPLIWPFFSFFIHFSRLDARQISLQHV